MNRKLLIGMLGFMIFGLIIFVSEVKADSITFNSPTPANNTYYITSPQNITINVTVDIASALQNFSYVFNGNTYTFLDSTTKLFMPLDTVLQSNNNLTLDYSSYQNNGTATGYTLNDGTRQGGQSGQTFNSGQYLTFNSSIIYNGSFTATIWFSVADTSSTSHYLINNYVQDTSGFRITTYSNTIYAAISNGTKKEISGGTLSVGEIKAVTLVFDDTNDIMLIYVNGTYVSNTSISHMATAVQNLYIGRYYSGTPQYFNGSIYRTSIYNRALNSSEILSDYNAGAYSPTPIGSRLVAQYLLNDSKYSNTTHVYDTNYLVQGKDSSSQAYNFNGSQYVNFNGNVGSNFTFCYNAIRSELGTEPIVAKANVAPKARFSIGNTYAHTVLYNASGGVIGSAFSTMTYDFIRQFNNVCTVSNGTNLSIYVNGLFSGSVIMTEIPTPRNINYLATAEGSNSNLVGAISDVQIFNRSLSAQEVAKLYSSSFKRINATEWTFQTNESNLVEGNYNYSITAQSTTSARTLTVDATYPIITLTSIEQGTTNKAYFGITGSVTDNNINNTQISIYKNGAVFIQYNQTTNTTINYNLTNLENGLYSYNVTAIDLAGFRSTTSLYNITINATPNITSPTANQNITQYVNITWNDIDNSNITRDYVYLQNGTTSTLLRNYTITNGTLSNTTCGEYFGVEPLTTKCTVTINGYIDSMKLSLQRNGLNYDGYAQAKFNMANGSVVYSQVIHLGPDPSTTPQEYTLIIPDNNQMIVSVELQGNATGTNAFRFSQATYQSYTISYRPRPTNNYTWNTYNNNLTIGQYYINITSIATNNYAYSSIQPINIVANMQLNITATNYITNANVTTFNIILRNNNTGVTQTLNTSTGLIQANIIRTNTYIIYADVAGYAYANYTTTTTNAAYQNYLLTLYTTNSLLIRIYDETTLGVVTQNTTVTLTDITNPKILTGSTINGNITFPNLTINGDIYEVRFTTQNYSASRYYRIVLDRAVDFLYAYLLPISTAQNVSLCFYTTNGVPISGLSVYENAISNTGYITSSNLYTDINGKVIFSFNPSTYYMYNYSTTTYNSRPFILNPPKNNVVLSDGCNYDITLTTIATTTTYNTPNVTGDATYNNNTKIITFAYTSTDNTITTYTYTVAKVVNGQYTIICTGNAATLTNTFTCDVTGYEGAIYVQGIADNDIFYGGYINIPSSTGLFSTTDSKEGAFWAGFIALLITIAGTVFGPIGLLIGSVSGILVIFWLGIFTPITVTFIIVASIVCVVILVKMRQR